MFRASVRGPYRSGNNHFPIQDFHLQETIQDQAGGFTLKTVATALKAHQDRYHSRCPIKWRGEALLAANAHAQFHCNCVR